MTPQLIHCDSVTCLNVTGLGEPGGSEHVSAIGALYAVASAMGGADGGPLVGGGLSASAGEAARSVAVASAAASARVPAAI
ncbi:hypothetical protein Ssi02_50340 [Sinosporangium siamense]|uniref:Uncharacterized protein n=1 Tax=Sinosporangium siamense TaxID=1367973 RepID=A0A919V8U4_9ACTN|nr:hypothetical protein Ssi02_50340 [Sinosporangium siamense]